MVGCLRGLPYATSDLTPCPPALPLPGRRSWPRPSTGGASRWASAQARQLSLEAAVAATNSRRSEATTTWQLPMEPHIALHPTLFQGKCS